MMRLEDITILKRGGEFILHTIHGLLTGTSLSRVQRSGLSSAMARSLLPEMSAGATEP